VVKGPTAPKAALAFKKASSSTAPNSSALDTVEVQAKMPAKCSTNHVVKQGKKHGASRSEAVVVTVVPPPPSGAVAIAASFVVTTGVGQGVAAPSMTSASSASNTTSYCCVAAAGAARPECNWHPGATFCFGVFGNNLDTCNHPVCNNKKLHHGCQDQWEYDHDAEADGW